MALKTIVAGLFASYTCLASPLSLNGQRLEDAVQKNSPNQMYTLRIPNRTGKPLRVLPYLPDDKIVVQPDKKFQDPGIFLRYKDNTNDNNVIVPMPYNRLNELFKLMPYKKMPGLPKAKKILF